MRIQSLGGFGLTAQGLGSNLQVPGLGFRGVQDLGSFRKLGGPNGHSSGLPALLCLAGPCTSGGRKSVKV